MRKRSALAVAGALLFLLWQVHEGSKAHALFGDFHAFYCAGSAVARGAVPYDGAALYPCESAIVPLGLYSAANGVAVPAPLPGYALAAFVPLALLPYKAACAVWLLVVVISLGVAARALALLLDRSVSAALCAIVPGIAIVVVPFGELASIVLAALLCMALALRRGAWGWAASAGAVAAVLPQIGVPALVACAIFVPAMRLRVVAAAVVLGVLDLAGSSGAALSYLFAVLPAHARAEIASSVQYGVTWMLHAAHASDSAALAAGSVSYAASVFVGIAAARAASTRIGDDAGYALVPSAFAVFGGTFVHYAHIMCAIPAALLLAVRLTGWRKIACAAAALLLMVPWLWLLAQPLLLPVLAAACALCASALLDCTPRHALRIALAVVALAGVVLLAGAHFGAGATSALVQHTWSGYINAERSASGPAWWIAKAPTWIGLLLLLVPSAALLAMRKAVPLQAAAATAAPR